MNVTDRVSPYASAMLCADTAHALADRMRAVLDGQFFTLVVGNSYDEDSDRFSSIEVYPSQRLTNPIRVNDGSKGINWGTSNLAMGAHTSARTQDEGRNGGIHQYVHFTFDPGRVTIDHYAPAGYRLRWIFAVEFHPEDTL